MELPKVIDQLEELIADRESFIYSDGEARGIYIADKEALEEAAELIAACSKYLRACGIGQPTPVTVDEALAMIGEEVADVNLVTDVIRRQSEVVEDVFVETANRKIFRWKGRLENGKQG